LLDDPRFSTIESRLEHFEELMGAIVSWAVTVSDADEIEARFARHGLATGRLRSVGEIADTDWARDRGAITEVSDRKDGAIRVPNSPWHFSSSDTSVTGVAKYRGEDNREVCRTLLGMSDADIARLESIGVLVSRVPQA